MQLLMRATGMKTIYEFEMSKATGGKRGNRAGEGCGNA